MYITIRFTIPYIYMQAIKALSHWMYHRVRQGEVILHPTTGSVRHTCLLQPLTTICLIHRLLYESPVPELTTSSAQHIEKGVSLTAGVRDVQGVCHTSTCIA
jgi:hypothetical protein